MEVNGHKYLTKLWQKLLAGVTVISILTGGFTLAGGLKWLGREFGTHEEIDSLKAEIVELKKAIEILQKADEFTFHFGRFMTDDNDVTPYHIDASRGVDIHEVDRRMNNEEKEFAFVFDVWWIMELEEDDADSTRFEIMWNDGKPRTLYEGRPH